MDMKTNQLEWLAVSLVDPLFKLLEDCLDLFFELVFRQIIELAIV